MLDQRNLKVAAPGIMRQTPESVVNGPKIFHSAQCVCVMCALTLKQQVQTQQRQNTEEVNELARYNNTD